MAEIESSFSAPINSRVASWCAHLFVLAAEGLHQHLVDDIHTVVQLVAKYTRNNTAGESTNKHVVAIAETILTANRHCVRIDRIVSWCSDFCSWVSD